MQEYIHEFVCITILVKEEIIKFRSREGMKGFEREKGERSDSEERLP